MSALPRYLTTLGITDLPMNREHALAAAQIDWAHRDPFDRMLADQAIVENAVLVSADAAFASLSGLCVEWDPATSGWRRE